MGFLASGMDLLSLIRKTMHMLELSSCPLHPSDPWKMFKPAIYVHPTKLWEGHVFSRVCLFGGEGESSHVVTTHKPVQTSLRDTPRAWTCHYPCLHGTSPTLTPSPYHMRTQTTSPSMFKLVDLDLTTQRSPLPGWHSTEMPSRCKLLMWNIKPLPYPLTKLRDF